VTINYRPTGRRELTDHVSAEIEQALAEGARRVLVFMAGWQPMQRVQQQINLRIDGTVHLLHSRVSPELQQRALLFDETAPPDVVLATNIAETSLTIAGVDTVIDSGQVRRPFYDVRRGMDQLETGWISRASADQRAGRAGRLGPGRCIRLWSQDQQGRLLAHDPAEIQQVDLAPLALELALWGSVDLLLPEPPPAQRLAEARQLLLELEALDYRGHITAAGRAMAALGLHPRLGRLVLYGGDTGQRYTACQLAALLSEGDFLRAEGVRASADIDWRMQLLQRRPAESAGTPVLSGVVQRIQQLTRQLLQRAGGADQERRLGMAGALLLAAYPDRLAHQREPGSTRYLTADGFEVQLTQEDPLRKEPWLVIAEHDGDRRGARVRLAAAIGTAEIESVLGSHFETQEEVAWDDARQIMTGRSSRRLGSIVLDERVIAVTDAQANDIWLAQLRARGLDWLQWPEAVVAWLGRVRWVGHQRADWPDFSAATLLADAEEWLLPYLAGVRRIEQLRALDFGQLLRQRLDYPLQQQLERFAPAQFTLPSGLSHAIEYRAEGPPRLAARLQEFYGLNQHPSIAEGRQPLLLELLSPARRPVQVTQDLPGFWRGSYPEVRKDMKGRYPKHFWPEEPWAAPATTVTKRKMQSPTE
jgi:ATP-dependent helicase HrpB